MTTKYQQQFEISRTELEIIEMALREQTKSLSKEMLDQQVSPDEQEGADDENQLNCRVKAIQSLLGNLHNQKIWYRPQNTVPLG